MKKLMNKAVLCSDWFKIGVGVSIIAVGLLLPGCSTVKGMGQFMAGVSDDTIGLSNAIKNEIAKDK